LIVEFVIVFLNCSYIYIVVEEEVKVTNWLKAFSDWGEAKKVSAASAGQAQYGRRACIEVAQIC